MFTPAARMQHYQEHFFSGLNARLAELRAEGAEIIRLDEGAPDLPPASHIIEALAMAARRPDTHSYQPQRGFAELRQAWAEMYRRAYGVMLDPELEVLPLLGSKEGIFHLPLAAVDPGQVVLVPDPGYVTYARGAYLAGAELYRLPLEAENGYLPDLLAIPPEILRKARLLWINYPNNPTAVSASLDFFHRAVDLALQHQLILCHDAAYTQVTFSGFHAPSLLEVPSARQVSVEFNTLSKSHNMAGWRVAAMVGNPELIRTLHSLKTNIDSGHFRPVLEAAVAAMTGDQSWLMERNEIYRQRRDVVIQALNQMGIQTSIPRASLYVWFAVPAGFTSAGFQSALLDRAHISLTPGSIFGSRGEGFLRLSLTAPLEKVAEAMLRLGKFLKENT